jgi:hypothetical protein
MDFMNNEIEKSKEIFKEIEKIIRADEREKIKKGFLKQLERVKNDCIVNGVIIGSKDVEFILDKVCGKKKIKRRWAAP